MLSHLDKNMDNEDCVRRDSVCIGLWIVSVLLCVDNCEYERMGISK